MKRQEEAVQQLSASSLAAWPLPLGTAASFSPAFGCGEEQQGGVNPVPGHGGRGVRNKKKTVTQEEDGDAESVYADFPRVDLAFRRLLSGSSGFVCLSKRNRSRARAGRCLGMMAGAMQLLAASLAWFWAVPVSSASVPRHGWGLFPTEPCCHRTFNPMDGSCDLLLAFRAKSETATPCKPRSL